MHPGRELGTRELGTSAPGRLYSPRCVWAWPVAQSHSTGRMFDCLDLNLEAVRLLAAEL